MRNFSCKRLTAFLLSVMMAVTVLSGSVFAEEAITVKKLKSYAKDYNVSEEFLEEISGETQLSKAELKKYASAYGLPAQYVQRFFSNTFVFKSGNGLEYVPINKTAQMNQYNWNNLVKNSKEIKYVVDGATKSNKGIDVSEYQGKIDWKKVKADGVKFAFIRVGCRGYRTGKLFEDQTARINLKNATAAGVKVGVYFYSQAATVAEARQEAAFVLDLIEGYSVTYPVVFDMEGPPDASARTARLTKTGATQIADAFCVAVKSAGYRPMIYTYTKWFAKKLDIPRLEKYDFWLAQYYEEPFFPYDFQILQYKSTGRVKGINGDVDMNLSFKNY